MFCILSIKKIFKELRWLEFILEFLPRTILCQGGSGSQGGRARPPGKPQKIIQAPAFENIKLQRSQNAWVRPSEKAKAMLEEERAIDVRLSLFMYKFY